MNPNLNPGNGPQRVDRAASASHGTGLVRIGPTSQRPGAAGTRPRAVRAGARAFAGAAVGACRRRTGCCPTDHRVADDAAASQGTVRRRSRRRPGPRWSRTAAAGTPALLVPHRRVPGRAGLWAGKEEHTPSPGGPPPFDECAALMTARPPARVIHRAPRRHKEARTPPFPAVNAMGRWTYCPWPARDTESLSRPPPPEEGLSCAPGGFPRTAAPTSRRRAVGCRVLAPRISPVPRAAWTRPAAGLRNRTEFRRTGGVLP